MHILRQIKGTILFITSLEVSCIYNTYDAVVKVFKGLNVFFFYLHSFAQNLTATRIIAKQLHVDQKSVVS